MPKLLNHNYNLRSSIEKWLLPITENNKVQLNILVARAVLNFGIMALGQIWNIQRSHSLNIIGVFAQHGAPIPSSLDYICRLATNHQLTNRADICN